MKTGQTMGRRARVLLPATALATGALLVPALAFGHIERPSYWPDPGPENVGGVPAGGGVPEQRSLESAATGAGPGDVRVVCQGRTRLSETQVRALADGSVYTAQEALDRGLIDDVGFFEKAVEEAKRLAGLSEARVIKYEREPNVLGLLRASAEAKGPALLNVTPDTLNAWSTPRVMMLWRG